MQGIRLLIGMQLLLILLVVSPGHSTYAQEMLIENSDWLRKVQVMAWKSWATDIPTSGASWGFEFNIENCPTCLTAAVDYYHQKNELYMSAMQFTPTQQTAITAADHGCFGLDGEVIFQDENATSESRAFAINLHHPEVADIIKGSLEGVIDAGADGLTIDGYNPNVQGFRLGGCFDQYTNEFFREYLAEKFTTGQLQSSFSISDISSFNFKQWIQDNNRENDWNAAPYTDLSAEFYIAEWLYARGFLQAFIDHGKTYALSQTGRDFSVTENNAGSHWISTDLEDLVSSETFYYQRGGQYVTDYAATNIKISKAFNSAVAFLPEVCSSTDLNGELVTLDIPLQNQNLLKYIIGDIYSAGGWLSVQEYVLPRLQACGSFAISYFNQNEWIDVRAAQASYFPFILNNRYLFEDLFSDAKLGLVYSIASDINVDIKYSDSNVANNYRDSHDGFSKILLEGNIQHNSVVLGDGRFHEFDTSLEQMSNYEALLLADVYALSDSQVENIIAYVENGGTVFKYGDFGITDENENLVSRSEILPWANPGTYTMGNGKVISFADNVGSNYSIFYQESDKQTALSAITSEITPILDFAEDQMLMAVFYDKQDSNNKIVHIRNNDFDPEADAFTASNPVELSFSGVGAGYDAILFSPDQAGPIQLDATVVNNSLIVSLPSIEAYAVLLLEEQTSNEVESWQARFLPASNELYLPAVQALDNQFYDLVLRLVSQEPYIFELISAEVSQQILSTATYDVDREELEIPSTALDDDLYSLTMGLLPNINPVQFQLFSAALVQ